MSHHLNLDFNVLPTNKEPTSKKLQKKPTNSAKKKESRKLDIDNKEMEWRLLQLKQAMGKEKEERGKHGFWKSGNKDGALDSHARNILGRSVKSNSSKSSSPSTKKSKKVVVLKDEPLDLPKKDSHTKKLIGKLMTSDPKLSDLSVNDTEPAPPLVNKETWISVAPDRHSDDIMELQSDQDGNLPLQSLQGIYHGAIGLFFMRWGRKRLLVGVDGKIMRPKTGWGSEVYYPYNGTTTPRQAMEATPSPPSFTLREKPVRKSVEQKHGGLLLKGDFNEDDSAESFQKALQEWRSQPEKVVVPPANTPTSLVEMSVHTVQSEPISIEINFSEYSTLSYMEKLLLKKHRSSDVPPLPDLNFIEQENHEMDLTVAEMEEKEQIRQLFTPQPFNSASEDSMSTIGNQSAVSDGCLSAVVIQEVVYDDLEDYEVAKSPAFNEEEEESVCFVEEASDQEEDLESLPSYSGIQIEEIFCSPPPRTNSRNSSGHTGEDATPVETPGKSPSPIVERSDPVFVPAPDRVPQRPAQEKRTQSAVRRNKLLHRKEKVEKRAKTTMGNYSDFATKTNKAEEVSLVSVIGNLPQNPDAVYRRGLGDFFTEPKHETNIEAVNLIEDVNTDIMLKNKVSWNPVSSLVETLPDNYEVVSPQNNLPPAFNVPATPAELIEEELEREEEDAKALDRLEWELASQTGNLTEDGRVSRMIDEWSSDDEELGIINDPGLGSGLSTPEVDQASIGNVMSTTPTWQESDKIHQQNFQDMEQAMMADLSSGSDSEMEYPLF